MRGITFELNEEFLEDCLTSLDIDSSPLDLTKNEFAKLGIKLLHALIDENVDLKCHLKEKDLKIENLEEENAAMSKEAFDRNTREIGLEDETKCQKLISCDI